MSDMTADDRLIDAAEAADILCVSVRTIKRLQAAGMITPVYVQPARTRLCRYRRSEIVARLAPLPVDQYTHVCPPTGGWAATPSGPDTGLACSAQKMGASA